MKAGLTTHTYLTDFIKTTQHLDAERSNLTPFISRSKHSTSIFSKRNHLEFTVSVLSIKEKDFKRITQGKILSDKLGLKTVITPSIA